MKRFFFWGAIISWIIAGIIAVFQGKPLPPANVFSIAGCFILLYFIIKDKNSG
jgi:hypothetical protein